MWKKQTSLLNPKLQEGGDEINIAEEQDKTQRLLKRYAY